MERQAADALIRPARALTGRCARAEALVIMNRALYANTRMKIAIQGQVASFHDQAARRLFGNSIELICCETFADVFAALKSSAADYAVVAVENSLHGPITPVYDLLLRDKPWMFKELYLQIHQCLIGLPGTAISDIQEVYSHVAALSQCEDFLTHTLHDAKHLEHADTAGAVADVATWGDKTKAAIASAAAAEHYGLEVLQANIETNAHNYTRFVTISREEQPTTEATKTSIVLRTNHQTGALYRALGVFEQHNINLTMLTSRPIIGQHQRYMFYLDFNAGIHSPAAHHIIDELRSLDCEVIVLGSYDAAELPR